MPEKKNHIFLTVRDLVQWSSGTDLRLSGFPLYWRGILGRRTQSRIHDLKPDWRQEYPVDTTIKIGPFNFRISGKIDLLSDNGTEATVEEIKTVVLSRSGFNKIQIDTYPQFTEQLLIYCYLYHLSSPVKTILPRLTIVNLLNEQTRSFDLHFDPDQIKPLILSRLKSKINELGIRRRRARIKARLAKKITFDPGVDRSYQREIVDTIREGLQDNHNTMISAPTGSGKTIAALFPVIKYALENDKRIFFLTAKNTQQDAVAHNLELLLGPGFPFTTLFLRAREKMCAHSIYYCHADYCPYADGFYQRMQNSGISEQLLKSHTIYPEQVYDLASRHLLCPAETQFALSRQVDLVVGDYNYIFDPSVYLQSLFYMTLPKDWILIIDEAHNLYTRALQLLSPELSYRETESLYRYLNGRTARIYQRLRETIHTVKELLLRIYQNAVQLSPHQQAVLAEVEHELWRDAFNNFEQVYLHYLLHRVRYHKLSVDDPIEQFYGRLRVFVQILETADSLFTTFMRAEKGGTLKIQCCDPSVYLRERHDTFHAVIAMSATLDPMDYYATVLGFRQDNTRFLRLAYPFQAARRKIVLVPEYDTRLHQRHQNYPNYAGIIKKVVSMKPGNYIVFFPSFEFLQATNVYLGTLQAQKLFQRSQMDDKERDEIIEMLKEDEPPKLLLAVTGGIFAEGIDLPGEACIGVIIFGPSLPAITPERELIRDYYDRICGDGFTYAYIYPGMTRVIQAAGRLIRSDQDYGILVLVGDRLADEQYSDLFPEYWGDLTITTDYQSPLIEFWQKFKT